MGCSLGRDVHVNETAHLDAFLTYQEVTLVKESWKTVSEDLPGLGFLIFKKFFDKQKDLTRLFGRLMARGNNGDMELDEEKLKYHATIVMEGLGAAVESIDDSVYLTNILITMGEKHATYNVHPDMVPYFWPAVKEALHERLGEKFSPEVERSWGRVFEYFTCKFKQGITNINPLTSNSNF